MGFSRRLESRRSKVTCPPSTFDLPTFDLLYTVHPPVSRILFPAERGDDHFSSRFANEARSRSRGMRLLPGDPCRAGDPSPVLSCTTRGLPCLLGYRRSGGLLPHHFNLTCALAGHRRIIFCCTFRPVRLAPNRPSFSQGTLPFGVRTFLETPAETKTPRSPREWSGRMRAKRQIGKGKVTSSSATAGSPRQSPPRSASCSRPQSASDPCTSVPPH